MSASILIFAPSGIGEVSEQTDLTAEILAAVAADQHGPLVDGDILVVTSKIISKLEGRFADAVDKPAVLADETVRTVARRGRFAIVETRHGLVQAAAGIDASNVAIGTILTLPLDPDASARRLLDDLARRTGRRLGVIISDTSGRAWRTGQTDHAIGVAGVRPVLGYRGQFDPYGNPLQVTEMAVADELTGAADLAKQKLGGRPVAVIRGAAELLEGTADQTNGAGPGRAADLQRPVAEDLFRLGTRESVIEAVAVAVGVGDRAEHLFALATAEVVGELTAGLDPSRAGLVTAMIERACDTAPATPGT